MRGALTTGYEWYFVVVDVNTNNDGAKYWVSEKIIWYWSTEKSAPYRKLVIEETSCERDPALVAGILSSWVSLPHPDTAVFAFYV